jgi:RNA polymerase sigma factor (sigma-70 family)
MDHDSEIPGAETSEPEIDLERWIQTFRGPLVGLLASWGADWRAAEELAQEAFAEAWLGRARFRGDPSDMPVVGRWLRGIAFNLSCAAGRRRDDTQALTGESQIAEPASEEVEDDERRAHLVRAFAQLSGPHQTVLRMHYLEETSAREVAALLGLTPKAVEDRLYQARRELRGRVERVARSAGQGVRS